MNIYLDIDGVLLANEENLAIGVVEFIKYACPAELNAPHQKTLWIIM